MAKIKKFILIPMLIIFVLISTFGVFWGLRAYHVSIYHREYIDFVKKYSAEFDVDENLLFAIIKTESDFNADATSNVGARGLMQFMPDTFNWVKAKLKDEKTTFDDMYNPEDNIRFGAFLIKNLEREFGSKETAIAAYHAGRGAVNKWLRNQEYSGDKKALDQIPIDDTAHYVNKVIACYEMYAKLYE